MFLANLEKQFSVLKEQLYRERINQVDTQLTEVRGGRSVEYLGPLQRLNDNMRIRTEVAGILKRYRQENIDHKFWSEEQAAKQHYEVSFIFNDNAPTPTSLLNRYFQVTSQYS